MCTALRLFNSSSRKKEEFVPLNGKTVKIYVCGITPYDTTHLGHAFTYVSFDTLIRYLKFKGFDVVYTQNVTDIDDDILRKARAEGRDWKSLGDFWTKRYLTDMERLKVSKPAFYVKATDSIQQMIRIIGVLLERGFAYKSGGNVYFEIKRFPRYGNLSNFSVTQMKQLLKERGGKPDDPDKKNPLDFVLWQESKEGEPFWNAPWGNGRPGWHIECSAMVLQYLGEQIDIHGGGRDLVFPHHESEIAQSESFTGRFPFARYFIHTAMVMNMGEKMSKSFGNLILISDMLREYSPNAIRWVLLSHHYRQVWEYAPEEFDEAELYVDKIVSDARTHRAQDVNKAVIGNFANAMDDDLNTPEALRILKTLSMDKSKAGTIRYMMDVLGFNA